MPLVTTRVGGIPEIFTDESDHLVPPSDAPALASAMRALSEKPEAAYAFADQMREAIRDRFSVEAMTAGIESVYREVTLPDD